MSKSTFQTILHSLLGNSGVPAKSKNRKRTHTCRIEELEGREMLSATPWTLFSEYEVGCPPPGGNVGDSRLETASAEYRTQPLGERLPTSSLAPLAAAPELNPLATTLSQEEFDYLREEQYADLNLSANMADYNIIVITANNLTDTAIRDAIDAAALTTKDDLIVCRTTATQNTITLGGNSLLVDFSATTYGSVAIVSLGTNPLTINANNQSRAFTITGSNSDVALAGLTITNGNGIKNYGESDTYDGYAGGILCAAYSANFTMTKCTVRNCTASDSGGGIYNDGRGAATITDSTISGNTATNYGGGIDGKGMTLKNVTISGNEGRDGGGFAGGAGSTLIGCTIKENTATEWGGGMYVNPGSVGSAGLLTIIGGKITDNNVLSEGSSFPDACGGGIYNVTGTLVVTNCEISGNTAKNHCPDSSVGAYGGGIYNDGKLTLTNCLIVRNEAVAVADGGYRSDAIARGGGVFVQIGSNNTNSVTLTNCTIAQNNLVATGFQTPLADPIVVLREGGGIYCKYSFMYNPESAVLTLNNTIVVQNTANGVLSNDIDKDSTNGIVAIVGKNNLTAFSDWGSGSADNLVYDSLQTLFEAGSYQLAAGAQAIDAGNDDLIPVGITADLAGNYRIAGERVDIGAYEHGSTPALPLTPGNFRSTTQTQDSITLAWDSQFNLTGYTLEYKKASDAGWTTWSPAPGASATSATITGLQAGTEYNFRLTAINFAGSTSATASAATKVGSPVKPLGTGAKPVKVSGIKKTNISLSTATISWKANAKNTFYEVVCTSHPGVDKVELLGNTVTFAGLNPKTSYKFKIISYNGETVAKKAAKVSVKTKAYAAPKGIKKTSTSDSITLTWKSSPFVETDRYEVICKDKKGNVVYPVGDPNIVVIGTSATISNLNSKTSYKFEIRAVSDLLGGLQSKVAKVSVKTKK